MDSAIVVIYTRVSTEDQARAGYSLPEQVRGCRSKAEELGRSLGLTPAILEFTDDMSGEILERPGLQSALELLGRQKVAAFVCADPDRLARSLVHQLLITEQIERTGCQLEFVSHEYSRTDEGVLFYQMRGAFAQFEKTKIKERTSRGMRGKVRAGGIPHQLQLYGYHFRAGAGKVLANQALTPDPIESEWVRTVYRWCAEEGLGPQAIANRLNELGVATKHGKRWQHAQVRRMLRHEVYVTGKLPMLRQDHRGIAVARQLSKAERLKRGIKLSPIIKPESEWQHVLIEPIVSQDLRDRAHQVLEGFRIGDRVNNHPGNIRMLTSLGRCGICSSALHYFGGRKIMCSARYKHYHQTGLTPSSCTLPAKPVDAVEQAVWSVVRSWILNPLRLQSAITRVSEADERPADVANDIRSELVVLDTQLTAKRDEQQRIGLLFAKGLWNSDLALPALDGIKGELESLEKRRLDLANRLGGVPVPHQVNPILQLLADPQWQLDMAEDVDRLSANRRAELVRLAVARFVMFPSQRGEAPAVTLVPR